MPYHVTSLLISLFSVFFPVHLSLGHQKQPDDIRISSNDIDYDDDNRFNNITPDDILHDRGIRLIAGKDREHAKDRGNDHEFISRYGMSESLQVSEHRLAIASSRCWFPHQSHPDSLRRRSPKHQIIPRLTTKAKY